MKPSTVALWLLALLFLSVGFTLAAKSHSFYDPYCCNDKDCQPIKGTSVKETAAGYEVTLSPAEHIGLKKEDKAHTYVVRYGDAKPSPDGAFHACILPYMPDTMRCFYAPVPGS